MRGADGDDAPDRLGRGVGRGEPRQDCPFGSGVLASAGGAVGAHSVGRKAYNGRVERSHRTDDEAFDLPCVLSLDTVEAFLGAGLGWLYYYNYERVHSGYGMAGRTPYGCCVALGFSGSEYVGLMPVVLSDNIVLDWSRQGVPAVNDVLTHYMIVGVWFLFCETTKCQYRVFSNTLRGDGGNWALLSKCQRFGEGTHSALVPKGLAYGTIPLLEVCIE